MLREILYAGLTKSAATLLLLLAILSPLMIVIEYTRRCGWLEKLAAKITWLTRLLKLPGEAALPLLVGLTLGLFYGAGVILEYGRQGLLQKRDLVLLGVFLSINHSLIEDNLLLIALGANAYVLFLGRFLAAFLLTRVAGWLLDRRGTRRKEETAQAAKNTG